MYEALSWAASFVGLFVVVGLVLASEFVTGFFLAFPPSLAVSVFGSRFVCWNCALLRESWTQPSPSRGAKAGLREPDRAADMNGLRETEEEATGERR